MTTVKDRETDMTRKGWRLRARKIAVILEIVVVFFVGTLTARFLLTALGIVGSKQAIQSASSADFDAMSVAVPMIIRWSIVISLAFIVGWIVAGHGRRDYGLTLANRSLWWHCVAGFVTLAIGFLPIAVLLLLRHHFNLSGGPPIWETLEKAPRTLDFWLFVLASSVVIPPLVEETYFRGYALTRLSTVFTPITAIITIAVLFVLAHVQYFDGSVLGTIALPLGLWQFIVLGVSRFRTGSLIAPIIAHAIGNVPMRALELWLLSAILVLILALVFVKKIDLRYPDLFVRRSLPD